MVVKVIYFGEILLRLYTFEKKRERETRMGKVFSKLVGEKRRSVIGEVWWRRVISVENFSLPSVILAFFLLSFVFQAFYSPALIPPQSDLLLDSIKSEVFSLSRPLLSQTIK